MKPILKVFVAAHCPNCDEARDIAARIAQDYPGVTVEVTDITDTQATIPDAVFATPTYMLNDRIVSLGNPSPDDIMQWLEEAMTQSA